MGWIGFLFRWNGRIRGGQLLVWSFGVGLLSTFLSMALMLAIIPPDPVSGGWRADSKFWLVVNLGQLPGWIATASLIVRRLHDLGHSAWWLIPFFSYLVTMQIVGLNLDIHNTWLGAVSVFPVFAAVVWLVAAPGEPQDNRYGPAPTS